jgi:uncharacterized integral membrane protein
MKIISSSIGIIVLALALSFAVANRENVTLNLWPFGIVIEAPLAVVTLGTLFFGVLAGALMAWIATLPHRLRARRLGKDIAAMREKLQELQQTVIPPAKGHWFAPPAKYKWGFGKKRKVL